MSADRPITVVTGDDDTLLREALEAIVDDLVGDDDPLMAVSELTEEDYLRDDKLSLGPVVDAACTTPMFTTRRVIVARHGGRFSRADDVAVLVDYLADPVATSSIVLVWERGANPRQDRLSAVPKSLRAAIERAGGTIVKTSVGSGRQAGDWLDERLSRASLAFTPRARARIVENLGEDRSRIVGLIDVLETAHGDDAEIDLDDVEPYLGGSGQVPPWELTDAIAEADTPAALDRLHRMVAAGGRHPLQILASLHTHYSRLLRLDGADVGDEKAAAALLGMKGSTFPAKKALSQTRALGSARISRAIALLADADRDLRGATAWPDTLVLEVLVARLAQLHRR